MKKLKREIKPKRKKTAIIKEVADKITKKSGVYKTAEFQSYVIWKSLPAMLRGKGKDTLDKFGISDEMSIEMLKIKSQTEFAEHYKIKIATCSEWNKIIIDENLINDSIIRWAKMITPNVIMALGKTAIATGKASEVMAWEKLVEGWKEKSEIGIDASEDLKKVLDKVEKILKLP